MKCVTNVDGSLLFITRQNPDLDISISKGSNAFWDTLDKERTSNSHHETHFHVFVIVVFLHFTPLAKLLAQKIILERSFRKIAEPVSFQKKVSQVYCV